MLRTRLLKSFSVGLLLNLILPNIRVQYCVLVFLVGVPCWGAAEGPDFNRDVKPILSENCFHCHGPDAATREAGLRLDLEDDAMHVLGRDNSSNSELLHRIQSQDLEIQMPPPHSNKQLDARELEVLQSWVLAGAEYEAHWSFVAPERPSLPPTVANDWCRNEVDAFTLDRMADHQLLPSARADRITLVRRVYLDLTGLPPSPEELGYFFTALSDEASFDLAYSELIDRLMSSIAYAEHMTLPWLEAARYADTDGYQNDRYRYQHAWRDWVLRAFSEHMPYDQFVVEQLAGDLLPEPTLRQQVATGFGRNHRINSEDGSIPEEWRVEYVVDRVDTVGTVFLGLTIGCARCHDHKYDPISQREYYQLFAYFNSIAETGIGPNNGNSPPFIELPESWPILAVDQEHAIEPEPLDLRPARKGVNGNGLKRPQPGSPQTVMVMHELDNPRETFLLRRGQYDMPDQSEALQPAVPRVLQPTMSTSEDGRFRENEIEADRLSLARWLVSPHHPLTARVAVNRIWQSFFGTGIVATSENFGAQGTPPSHPELLDWLAVELVENGWDLQAIQRKILLSATYQQASIENSLQRESDPSNKWLSRGPRMRLTPFVIRDQALASAGLLVEQTGGPSVKPYMPPNIWSAISNNKYSQDKGASLFRRSLYTYWRRTIPPPTMMNFNAAAREVCTVRNDHTNTPLQALTLMNNKTFVEAARNIARRVLSLQRASPAPDLNLVSSDSPEPNGLEQDMDSAHIAECFKLVLSRSPSDRELEMLLSSHRGFAREFAKSPEAAEALLMIGESPQSPELEPLSHAALTMTASIILNLDEAVTKE